MTTPAARAQIRLHPEIIAYVFPSNRPFNPNDINAAQLTRINYAFAVIQNGRVVEDAPSDAANLTAIQVLKQRNPSLQILISVGGWSGSGGFSDAVLTPKSRDLFVQSTVDFLHRYQLDGLDIDWEYPGLRGAGNTFRPEDGANLTLLLKALRARFDREEKATHKHLLLSIAAGSSDNYVSHSDLAKGQQFLDTINLMAYDYYEPSDNGFTGNHAPLYADPADPRAASSARSVQDFEQAGIPAGKIVLGVPFYGHVWGNVPPTNNGLFQTGAPIPNLPYSYAGYPNIAANLIGHGFVRFWDAPSFVPYLYSESQRQFISYEDPESLQHKCDFVRQGGLAGVMFWQYYSDPSGVLLNTVYTSLQNSSTGAQP